MIIQKLISIENEAQEAMRTLEKERTSFAEEAGEELKQCLVKIENKKNADISRMSQEISKATDEKSEQIMAEYKQKGSELLQIFAANKKLWSETIMAQILSGDL